MSDTPLSLLNELREAVVPYLRYHGNPDYWKLADRIDACLAEHADDGEPADMDFAEQLLHDTDATVFQAHGKLWAGLDFSVHLATRGDVRALASVLSESVI